MVGSHRCSAAAAWLQSDCRLMTHMPVLFHLHRLPELGNTLPKKAEGTLMGGRRHGYLCTHCELIKPHWICPGFPRSCEHAKVCKMRGIGAAHTVSLAFGHDLCFR
ncbi:hypothetical protein CRENBAI_021487 [Crenichthys baileyi]|uniref:Uncharacterized protein n=1 Tax=Crenichthys baileyi TaxID=28760 RepID=A0AAV9QX57_9TELE